MTTADFRAQARAVRAATQMKLMELRRNRRAASRYAAVEASPEPDAVATDLILATRDADSAPAFVEPVADDAPPLDVEAESARAEPVEAESVLTPHSPAATPTEGMTISSATADYIARAARPRAAAAPAVASVDPQPAEPPAVAVPAQRRDAPSDLFALADIGPGLVWLLERAGVASLADLRAADPDALSDRLGLVGRLIDVRALQARASAAR